MEWESRLDNKRDDGASERDHLTSAQRQIANLPGWRGPKVVVPESPPFPDELDYLYDHFRQLIIGIGANGMGPVQVTWEALHVWRVQMRVTLDPWECLALVRMGFARAAIHSEAMMAKLQKKPGQR